MPKASMDENCELMPRHADLMAGPEQAARFSEAARAAALYKMFKAEHLPCDIENEVGELTHDVVERIRKSDLIILDYNLTPGSADASKSIGLIRQLSRTRHFNTIVLYTLEKDLEGVWVDLACSLKGGWIEPEDHLQGDALAAWGKLADAGNLPSATRGLIIGHALSGRQDWPKDDRAALEKELLDRQVERKICNDVIEGLIHLGVRERLRDDAEALSAKARGMIGRCKPGGPRWLQIGNCFVAILGKQLEMQDVESEARTIMTCLDEALASWRPNLLQVLISEIQNFLELDALATDEFHLRDPETQISLSYYLLRSMEDGVNPEMGERLAAPLQIIIDKLVDTLRQRIASDEDLKNLAAVLFAEELKRIEWPPEVARPADMARSIYQSAGILAQVETKTRVESVLFRLNAFLSTEPFRRGHLTTGTVFRDGDTGECWLCASPACDMTARRPSLQQTWSKTLHPMRPMVAVKLHPEDSLGGALNKAELGRHVFVETNDEQLAFSVVDKSIEQPVFEFLFPLDAARAQRVGTDLHPSFEAFRIGVDTSDPSRNDARRFASSRFSVLGQLRPTYASRILQMVGQHLSRIGVDFIKLPN
nr:response regulator receiver domain [Methylobacterium sp. NI91]